ncbi:MAG TPA: hypothetical protein PLS49_04985 [Candidatus Woesebacteria bacterium]|nr:hypothetical protein [Candidatus Woesebacteria bacterium]
MEIVTVCIAGFNILIKFLPIKDYPLLKKKFKKDLLHYLRGFIVPHKENIFLTINIHDKGSYQLLYNNKKSFIEIANYEDNNVINLSYHIGISQAFIILSNLIYSLLGHHDGFILHGSVALINEKAHIFIGTNGAGKSTIIHLLKKNFLSLADDQVFIRKINNSFYFFQNPYIENATWIQKTYQPFEIGNVYELKKNQYFKIKLLPHEEALHSLLQNLTTSKENQEIFIRNLFSFFSKNIKCYEFNFNLDQQKLFAYFEKNE